MTALPLLLAVLASQVCSPSLEPLPPTIVVYGDSRMAGNLCSVTGPLSPPAYLDANLGGGTAAGVLVVNAAVSGTTPAQQRAAYENATTGESKACRGERCGYMVVGGAANCLRVGTSPATCLADHTWMVTDALSKGLGVVWFDETDYQAWASAGTNPTGQVTTYNGLWQTACGALAISNRRLKCLSLYADMGVPLVNTCDGVHDNQTGTNLRGSKIHAALLSIP